jgi:hypothetical protein
MQRAFRSNTNRLYSEPVETARRTLNEGVPPAAYYGLLLEGRSVFRYIYANINIVRYTSYVVLVLSAILIVGVIWLIKRPPSWLSDIAATVSSVTGRSQNKPAAPSSSADKPNPSLRRNAKAAPPKGGADAVGSTPATSPAPTAPGHPHNYPFPLAQDVPVGTSRSAVLERFGPPTAMVAGAETGQMRERFIYLEQGKNRKTVMFLTNGAVTSSETTVQ